MHDIGPLKGALRKLRPVNIFLILIEFQQGEMMKNQIISIVITTLISFSALAEKFDKSFCDQGKPHDSISLNSAKEIVLLIKNQKLTFSHVESGTIKIMKKDSKVNKIFLETPTNEDWNYLAASFLSIDNDKELIELRNYVEKLSLGKAAKELRVNFWYNLCD